MLPLDLTTEVCWICWIRAQGRWSFQCLSIQCTFHVIVSELQLSERCKYERVLYFRRFLGLQSTNCFKQTFWVRNFRHCVCLGAFTWTTHYLSRFASCLIFLVKFVYVCDQGDKRPYWGTGRWLIKNNRCTCYFQMKCWTSICCGWKWIAEKFLLGVMSHRKTCDHLVKR